MVDRVTSGSGEPSLADMILEQFAEAERNFKKDMATLQADLSRLSRELDTLRQELEALRAAPGDHQQEIAEIEQKITRKQMAIGALGDEIKMKLQAYQTQVDILSKVIDGLNKVIKDAADKIGR